MNRTVGRQLLPGPTDRSAAARTPLNPLRLIPPQARRTFVPYFEKLPAVRAGENDLTRIAPGRARAQGEILSVFGVVTDDRGRPIRNTLIEIWNANTWGRYTHEDDPAREPLDPNFLGVGRMITDDRGGYHFLTIKPGAYLARPDIGRWRPAHIHFSIRGGSSRLITQMYFEGEEWNSRDPCFHLLGDAQHRHIGKPIATSGADVSLALRFDIVIGGPNASWFES